MKFQCFVSDSFLLQTASDLTEFNNCPKPSQRGCSFLIFFFPRCVCVCVGSTCVFTSRQTRLQTHKRRNTACQIPPSAGVCQSLGPIVSQQMLGVHGGSRGKGTAPTSGPLKSGYGSFWALAAATIFSCRIFFPVDVALAFLRSLLASSTVMGCSTNRCSGKNNWTSINTPHIHLDKFCLSLLLTFSQSAKKGPMGKLCWDGVKAPKCCFHSCGTGGVHKI